jgi:hypothetical protein
MNPAATIFALETQAKPREAVATGRDQPLAQHFLDFFLEAIEMDLLAGITSGIEHRARGRRKFKGGGSFAKLIRIVHDVVNDHERAVHAFPQKEKG